MSKLLDPGVLVDLTRGLGGDVSPPVALALADLVVAYMAVTDAALDLIENHPDPEALMSGCECSYCVFTRAVNGALGRV
jgi:hypothetical protein